MFRRVVMTIGAVACASAAMAQPPAAGQALDLAASLQRGYANIKLNLTQSAEMLPDADFAFKVGTMAETRTFGQLFAHVANSQYGTCAAVKGVANPNQGNNLEQTATTKAAVVKALADSFAFCDDAFSSLTLQSSTDMVTQGRGQISKGAALANLVAHSNEMYGTAAAYIRTRGRVPPSTERATQGRGAAPAPAPAPGQ